jgi:VCBS repeat-containing protein
MRIYKNGQEIASTAKTGALDDGTGVPTAVGNQPPGAGSRPFDGLIDDVRIYTRTLTVGEIQSMSRGTLSVSVVGNGSVTRTPDQPNYNLGDSVLLTAIPDPGWVFFGWSGALSGSQNPATVVVTGDETVTATFEQGTGTYTVTTATVGNGAITLDPDLPDYAFGETVVVTAVPDSGWEFVGWSGGLSGSANPDTLVVMGHTTVTATFQIEKPEPSGQLVHHWTLDDGSGGTAIDIAGSNDGTLVNGPAWESAGGVLGGALRFDGQDDYVDLGDVDVPGGDSLTISLWFNADDFGVQDGRFISKTTGLSGSTHYWMLSTINNTGLRFRVRAGGATTTLATGTGEITTGQWYHVAGTYDGQNMRIYKDGVEVASAAKSGALDDGTGVATAMGNQPPGAGSRPFDGLIDDVRIYARTLSAVEIAAIAAGNQNPIAMNDAYATPEDTSLVVAAVDGVLTNDTDAELDPLVSVLASDVSNGVLNLSADGSFDYTPNPDFSGVDSFTYRANDGSGLSNPATVTLTVNGVNDAPVAVNDDYQTGPDSLLAVNAANGVLANDTDVDLDSLEAVLVDDVSNGVLSLNADGSFDYTPNTGFGGMDSFTYRANDNSLNSNLATVTINVLVPPVAVDDGFGTAEDSTLVVPAAAGVLANDTDNNPPDDLTASLLTNPANGSLTSFTGDGAFTYVPNPNYNGVDSFTYEAVDSGNGATAQATVILNVDAVNDAPVAVNDDYETDPNTPLAVNATIGVLENDTDVDLDVLEAVLVDDVSNGTLNLYADGSFDYTPNLDFSGYDTFTYEASDTALSSNLATVTISVASSIDPDAIVILPLDEGGGTLAGDVSGNGNDGTLANGAAFEANTGDGSAHAVRFDGADDRIELGNLDVNGTGLTLAAWFNADTFPGSSSDPRIISKTSGLSGSTHIFMLSTVQVGSAIRLRGRVRVGGSTTTLIASTGNVAAGQWYHAALTYDGSTMRVYLDGVQVGSTPKSGPVDVDPGMAVAVGGQPAGAGVRYFDGLIDDVRILQRALSAGEVAAILGPGDNNAPVAVNDAYQTDPNVPLFVDASNGVLTNDSDLDSDPLQAVLESDVSDGVLNLYADGSFDYMPNLAFTGVDSFTYRANDGSDNSNPATVTLTVTAVNDPPVAINDGYQTDPNTPLMISALNGVLANDTDPDLDPLEAVLVGDVSDGTLNLNADGSFDYTPNLDFTGTDGFTYRASDGLLNSNLASVTISVGDQNNPPQIVTGSMEFAKQVIGVNVDEAHSVVAADLDGDGDTDLAAPDYIDGMVFWYENDGGGGFVSHVLDGDLAGAYPSHVADVDLDGDVDVLACGYLAHTIVWYENDGTAGFTRRVVDAAAQGAHSVVTGDMDQDGDVDLLASYQDAGDITWYENDGNQNFTRHMIDSGALGAKRAEFSDVDDDGDWDVVTAHGEWRVLRDPSRYGRRW